VKRFTIGLLGVIFVTLIAGSIQSISADHLEPGQGIFKGESEVELVTTYGSNYQIYLLTVLRNGDGQLISVTETTEIGAYLPHKVTDHVFDTLMGKKEIVTIDNIKYEKVQSLFSLKAQSPVSYSMMFLKIEIHIFQVLVPSIILEPDDVITQQWTILRELSR
jgi:hypothetical protein